MEKKYKKTLQLKETMQLENNRYLKNLDKCFV